MRRWCESEIDAGLEWRPGQVAVVAREHAQKILLGPVHKHLPTDLVQRGIIPLRFEHASVIVVGLYEKRGDRKDKARGNCWHCGLLQ